MHLLVMTMRMMHFPIMVVLVLMTIGVIFHRVLRKWYGDSDDKSFEEPVPLIFDTHYIQVTKNFLKK